MPKKVLISADPDTVPVLYELDDMREAYGVLYFCSESCRDAFAEGNTSNPDGITPFLKEGVNDEYLDGTVCEQCGATLGHPKNCVCKTCRDNAYLRAK